MGLDINTIAVLISEYTSQVFFVYFIRHRNIVLRLFVHPEVTLCFFNITNTLTATWNKAKL